MIQDHVRYEGICFPCQFIHVDLILNHGNRLKGSAMPRIHGNCPSSSFVDAAELIYVSTKKKKNPSIKFDILYFQVVSSNMFPIQFQNFVETYKIYLI